MIDSKKVRDRRALRFDTVDDVLRDVELLVEAARHGTLRATGNWTLGQALAHLAAWINMPFDGYPEMRRPAWWMRLLRPLVNWWLIHKGFPAGVRIAGVPGGTFGIEPCEIDEGFSRLRSAFRRLAAGVPSAEKGTGTFLLRRLRKNEPVPGRHTSPVFGPMTREEWIKFHLRHAGLHLSFFHAR